MTETSPRKRSLAEEEVLDLTQKYTEDVFEQPPQKCARTEESFVDLIEEQQPEKLYIIIAEGRFTIWPLTSEQREIIEDALNTNDLYVIVDFMQTQTLEPGCTFYNKAFATKMQQFPMPKMVAEGNIDSDLELELREQSSIINLEKLNNWLKNEFTEKELEIYHENETLISTMRSLRKTLAPFKWDDLILDLSE